MVAEKGKNTHKQTMFVLMLTCRKFESIEICTAISEGQSEVALTLEAWHLVCT